MNTRVTASVIERAEGCPVSFSLPQITHASEWADRGSSIHEFIRARLLNHSLADALEHVDEDDRDTCRGIDLHALVGDLEIVRSEVAYAIDVKDRTVRELGVNIKRRYAEAASSLGKPLGPYEIPGTIDIEGRSRMGVESAGDVKTGFKPIIPVVEHRQVHWEVTARALATETGAVDGKIFKVLEGGEVKIDRHLFEPLELDTIGDELLDIQHGVIDARAAFQERNEIRVSPGPWCHFCDAFMVCPAQTDLARAVTRDAGDIVAALTSLTREQEWEAIEQWKAGEKVLDAIGAIMKGRAAQRSMMNDPITSPDGSKYFGPVSTTKASFSQPMALALLTKLGATQEQINALWIPSTFESFRILNVKKKAAPRLTAKRKKELAAKAKAATVPQLIDTSMHGKPLPELPSADASRSPTSRMRDRENDS